MNAYVLILLLLFTQWHERGSEKHGQIVLHIYTYAMHDIWQSANSQAAAHCCVRARFCVVVLCAEATTGSRGKRTNQPNKWMSANAKEQKPLSHWAVREPPSTAEKCCVVVHTQQFHNNSLILSDNRREFEFLIAMPLDISRNCNWIYAEPNICPDVRWKCVLIWMMNFQWRARHFGLRF